MAILEGIAVLLGLALLVVAVTWPQARQLDAVPDLGDPLFSVWRLSWVAHQLPRHPAALFDANIFYPERRTLTYSDSMLVPSLMTAPFLWFGVSRILVYNVLFLSSFVLSGAAMYLLVRTLTGRRDAAFVAAAVFTLYPYRFEHYSHLELQMTMWMPLALWALHLTLSRPTLSGGLMTGLAIALQALSSLYYGAFFVLYVAVVAPLAWLGHRPLRLRSIGMLAAGALVATVIVAPVAAQYVASTPIHGEWNAGSVKEFSARPRDYLKPYRASRLYGRWSDNGLQERYLFPTVVPVALAAAGAFPPMTMASFAYTAALALSVDASLGMNGFTFPWLRDHLSWYRSIRAPARFSILVGMTLAILGGYGAARLFTRWPRARGLLAAGIVAAVAFEARPALSLEPVWSEPPAIYGSLVGLPSGVLAEFPTPEETGMVGSDAFYLDFSTVHWHPMLNGHSGFMPASYVQFLQRTRDFPSRETLAYLRERGVTHITWHGAFSTPLRSGRVIRALDANSSDLELVAAARWRGSESRLYRFR